MRKAEIRLAMDLIPHAPDLRKNDAVVDPMAAGVSRAKSGH
jgi:hypothetical protein